MVFKRYSYTHRKEMRLSQLRLFRRTAVLRLVGSDAKSIAKGDVTMEASTNPFALRRSPYNLNQPGIKSQLLSDHPLSQKASRDEMAFRQRMLAQRGEYDEAAKVAGVMASTAEGSRHEEYRYVVMFAVLGYLSAHVVVYQVMHRDDVRLPYDPVKGFVDELVARKTDADHVDATLRDLFSRSIRNAKKPTLTSTD